MQVDLPQMNRRDRAELTCSCTSRSHATGSKSKLNRTKPTNLFISFLRQGAHPLEPQSTHHCTTTTVHSSTDRHMQQGMRSVHSLKRNFNRRPQLLPSLRGGRWMAGVLPFCAIHILCPWMAPVSPIRAPLNCCL